MNKETIFSIIRAILTIAGAFLVGKTVFGTPVDDSIWQTVLGGAMFVVSVIWGMVDKTATIEMFQSALRQIVSFAGGLLVAAGKLKAETVLMIIGIVPVVAPLIYAWLSKAKSKAIATGDLGIRDLHGVDEIKKGTPINPVMSTPK